MISKILPSHSLAFCCRAHNSTSIVSPEKKGWIFQALHTFLGSFCLVMTAENRMGRAHFTQSHSMDKGQQGITRQISLASPHTMFSSAIHNFLFLGKTGFYFHPTLFQHKTTSHNIAYMWLIKLCKIRLITRQNMTITSGKKTKQNQKNKKKTNTHSCKSAVGH